MVFKTLLSLVSATTTDPHNSPLVHLPKGTLFAPQNFAKALFLISLGMVIIPSRKKKKKTKVMQNFGGQKRCIIRDVQMVNSNNYYYDYTVSVKQVK